MGNNIEKVQHWGEISMNLSSGLDVDYILHKINAAASELVFSEASSILLCDDERLYLYFKAASFVLPAVASPTSSVYSSREAQDLDIPEATDALSPPLSPLGRASSESGGKGVGLPHRKTQGKKSPTPRNSSMTNGIAWWVAQRGEPAIVNDTSFDPRFTGTVDSIIAFETKSILCVPVILKGEVIGVLEAISKTEGAVFTEADLKVFSALANQVAIRVQEAWSNN